MALKYPVNISGMNGVGWYSATDPAGFPFGGEEAIRPYLRKLYSLGVRYLRNGGTGFSLANESSKILSRIAKEEGFDNIYGVARVQAGSTTTPQVWKDWQASFILPNALEVANGDICNTFSIGNEEEDRRGTQEMISAMRTSNIVIATFGTPHGYEIGDTVIIAGATPSDYNNASGAEILSVPSSTSFTYSAAGVDGTAAGTITAKMTVETFIRLIKATAVAVRAALPSDIKIIYSTTGSYVTQWVTAGITPGTDLDYWGLQTYSSSATDLASFRSIIQQAYDGFGALMWLTEWNLYFNWSTTIGQVDLERMQRETKARMDIIQSIGVARAYYYTLTGLNHEFEIMDYRDLRPRNAYYVFFSGKREYVIHKTSGNGNIQNTAIKASALRRCPSIDRGKCLDFNQSTSYVSGVFPQSFTRENLTEFTIAMRIFCDSLGGGLSGRILSTVNQKFVEIYVASNGINAQVWHSNANGNSISGAGTINLGTWQTVIVTFREGWDYARIYLDNIEKTTLSSGKSGSRGSSAGEVLSIGNRSDLIRGFDGKLDDFTICNRIWTDDEMNNYKNGHIPGGYLLYLDLEELSGNIQDRGPSKIILQPSNLDQGSTSYQYTS